MAGLQRTPAFTSQMLGFARSQLGFLDQQLNMYQQRVIKHAFISQTVNAFVAYLEEIDFVRAVDLPLVGLTAFLRNKLHTQEGLGDFRQEEIRQLLFASNEAWLPTLLRLYEESQHTAQIEKKYQAGNAEDVAQGGLIIAVAEQARLPLWWDYDKAELDALLSKLEAMIARQREHAAEA